MARDFFIAGESLVQVKGRTDSAIASLSQLGLSYDAIRVRPDVYHEDILLDAWGSRVPADVQVMLGAVSITINLIHVDQAVLRECLRLSMGGPTVEGEGIPAGP